MGRTRWFTDCGRLLFFGWLSTQAISAEVVSDAASAPRVIWQMDTPSKELKQRFPMCDEFLGVTWIDDNKEIGYARFDVLKDGKKVGDMRAALVYIDRYNPHFDYDLSFWWKGKMNELIPIIKKGEVEIPDPLSIRLQTGDQPALQVDFSRIGRSLDDELKEITLADYRQNVCIPFPPNKSQGFANYRHRKKELTRPDVPLPSEAPRMWIAEIKQVGRIYSDQQIEQRYEKAKSAISPGDPSFPRNTLSAFKTYGVLDVNFDGVEDYIAAQSVYSHGSTYYEMTPLSGNRNDSTFGTWKFPPEQRTCKVIDPSSFFLTTDGNSYFLNNTCNLTELTK